MKIIGTIGITRARLFDSNDKLIGYCLDTPNAIAKAFMECPKAQSAQGILGIETRDYYSNRMQAWNKAYSDLARKLKNYTCPKCESKRIDTTLNFNGADPNRNNCLCLDCGHKFNHQWKPNRR